MKNLLYKELTLVINPLFYLVALTGALLLIPQWPYLIAMMYFFFITVPNVFQTGKAANDIGFTVMLPVRKRDVVKARLYAIAFLELVQIAVAVPFAALNNALYPEGNFLIDINIAFFGLTFVMYGLFNLVFFPMFYRTAYKMGGAIIASISVAMLFAAAAETLAQVLPGAASLLDGIGQTAQVSQLPVLAAGIAVFVLLNWLAYRVSARRFERVDL
jgi:hypothetical protein